MHTSVKNNGFLNILPDNLLYQKVIWASCIRQNICTLFNIYELDKPKSTPTYHLLTFEVLLENKQSRDSMLVLRIRSENCWIYVSTITTV